MEEQKPLFDLNLGNEAKTYLYETARWGRFLAIVGLVVCSLLVIAGLYFAFMPDSVGTMDSDLLLSAEEKRVAGVSMAIGLILGALLYFFPCLYLLRFSANMKTALQAEDTSRLTEAFRQLKAAFRYVGILTIVILGIYVLAFVLGSLGGS